MVLVSDKTATLRTAWVPLREAARFVALHHRHHDPMQGGIVALGLWHGQDLIGVGVIGRPVSRIVQASGACEFVRVCVLEGFDGGASKLLSRTRRVAAALGFARAVTYTLTSESGSSLAGDGWQSDNGLFGGGEWTSLNRPRSPATAPTERKRRWWHDLDRQPDFLTSQKP